MSTRVGRAWPVMLVVGVLGLLVSERVRAECRTVCSKSEKLDSNGCCVPKVARLSPPPVVDYAALIAAGRFDEVVRQTARSVAAQDHVPVAIWLKDAGRCREALLVLAQPYTPDARLAPAARPTQQACRRAVAQTDVEAALQASQLDVAKAVVDGFIQAEPDDRSLDWRAARVAAARGDCAAARAAVALAQNAKVDDTFGDGAAVLAACPEQTEIPVDPPPLPPPPTKDPDIGFGYGVVLQRAPLGGRRSSEGFTIAVGGGGGTKGENSGLWIRGGAGLVMVQPGNTGDDSRMSSLYGLEIRFWFGSDPRKRVGGGFMINEILGDGKYAQGVADVRRGFVLDLGGALYGHLALGGGFLLTAHGGIRGGVMLEHSDPDDTDRSFGGRFHGISGLEAGLGLAWVCCLRSTRH